MEEGSITEIRVLSRLKVLTVTIDSSLHEFRHAGDLFFRLQRLVQSLPSQSLLEDVQIASWDSITFGPGMKTSALKLLDHALCNGHQFRYFKRLTLGFTADLERIPEDVRILTALFPELRDTHRLLTVGSGGVLIRSVVDRLLNQY